MSNTLILICDYQNDILKNVSDKKEELISNANNLLKSARGKGIKIGQIRVAFRPGHPEVSERNRLFSMTKKNNILVDGTEGAEIVSSLNRIESEPVWTKCRVSAITTTSLMAYCRGNNITKLVIGGVSTGGVVLTTTREAFDLDFELVVLKDLCADKISKQHDVLIETVLPNQCDVMTSIEYLDSLK